MSKGSEVPNRQTIAFNENGFQQMHIGDRVFVSKVTCDAENCNKTRRQLQTRTIATFPGTCFEP